MKKPVVIDNLENKKVIINQVGCHGLFLGKIISPFVMAIIFFLVVTPTGLFMRLLRKNLLNLRYSNDQSYWIKKNGPESKMKNQF